MTSDTFWTRYFFRVHQVEREEERRKALIQRNSSVPFSFGSNTKA